MSKKKPLLISAQVYQPDNVLPGKIKIGNSSKSLEVEEQKSSSF
jgi:hypothetical protein